MGNVSKTLENRILLQRVSTLLSLMFSVPYKYIKHLSDEFETLRA